METKLKEILEERMIKQAALARRIGITEQSMSAIVRGKTEPALRIALRIAKVLGVPVEEIWQEEEGNQK